MANLDNSTANAILKEYYGDQVVQNMAMRDNPFLAAIKKKGNTGGRNFPRPVIIETSIGGRSATFGNAQANQSAALMYEFVITRVEDHSIATITNELMLSAQGSADSFLDATTVLIDNAILAASNSLASALFRTKTGTIGTISTIGTVGTGIIQLTNPSDSTQFGVNQVLQANATDGGASPRAATAYVVSIDRDLGQLTMGLTSGGAAANPSGWAAADSLGVLGDLNKKVSGLADWFPFAVPSTTDNFFGVNRSVDNVRLAGVRYDASGAPIKEGLVQATMRGGREGAHPDMGWLTFESYAGLELELGSQVQYTDLKVPNTDISFDGIKLNGAKKKISLFPDRNQQSQMAHLVTMETLQLFHLQGDVPMIQRYGDGNEMLRVANADASELRVGYYANMDVSAPSRNIVTKLSV